MNKLYKMIQNLSHNKKESSEAIMKITQNHSKQYK